MLKRLDFYMIFLISFIFLLIYILYYVSEKSSQNEIILIEKAYFEGQKDALNGDIRIEKKGTGYKWIKSPWNDNFKPLYNP